MRWTWKALLVALTIAACAPQPAGSGADADVAPLPEISVEEAPAEVEEPVPDTVASRPPGAVLAPVARLVAIGDVHGDISALRAALKLALVIDDEDHWVGGATTVVQVGDQLDRGDDEREILHWLEELAVEARDAGGALYPMLGNHETMNVALDLRYVTAGGYADFADLTWDAADPVFDAVPDSEKGRIAAFRPGGAYALLLSRHVIALVVGDTAFVHGGLLPEHIAYGLDALNAETSAWMQGASPRPSVLNGATSPTWSRHYSQSPDDADCALLVDTLDALDVARMVVAHTVHTEGITSACQGQVWRVDVGLAAYYGGPSQVLLIEGDTLTVLP